jgi:DNA-binding response OmpR family regulator
MRTQSIRRAYFRFGEVVYKGQTALLPPTKLRILQALVRRYPGSLTTADLYRVLHKGAPVDRNDKSLARVHIAELRRRLDEQGMPIEIENRWGFGYRAVLK